MFSTKRSDFVCYRYAKGTLKQSERYRQTSTMDKYWQTEVFSTLTQRFQTLCSKFGRYCATIETGFLQKPTINLWTALNKRNRIYECVYNVVTFAAVFALPNATDNLIYKMILAMSKTVRAALTPGRDLEDTLLYVKVLHGHGG